MAAPYYPPAGSNPLDPVAKPNVTPAPAPPVPYQNTPEGRAAYLQNFASKPWFNQPLFDNYLQTHPDWTQNTEYWDKRLGDAPGTGSNAGHATSASTTRSPYMSDPTADLAQAGPQRSELLAQIMAELQAQQTGAPSPRERDVQLQMLRGGR